MKDIFYYFKHSSKQTDELLKLNNLTLTEEEITDFFNNTITEEQRKYCLEDKDVRLNYDSLVIMYLTDVKKIELKTEADFFYDN